MREENDTAGAAARSQHRELELLRAIGKRDRRAFTELYRIYQPRLHGYLRRFLAIALSADEIIDDVMFVVWTDAKKFRGQSAVSSWIFGIAYRKTLSTIRKEGRYQAGIDRSADTGELAAASPHDQELIRAGLASLSADHRQVVELTYFCGFSYQEIADIAGCPIGTVKTRMYHARRRLKVLLPKLAGDTREGRRDYY